MVFFVFSKSCKREGKCCDQGSRRAINCISCKNKFLMRLTVFVDYESDNDQRRYIFEENKPYNEI